MHVYLLQHLLLCTTGFVTAFGDSYELLAEAGEHGTRVYLFHTADDANGKPRLQMTNLGTGPALSSFEDSPDNAADSVEQQIDTAMETIPEDLRASVGFSFFGIGGLRYMDAQKRVVLYEGLENGVVSGTYPFNYSDFQVRTLFSREEGICAFIAANYLTNRIGLDLQVVNKDLVGVLDLTVSNMMIAVPPKMEVGETLGWHLDKSHMFIQSFTYYGEERIRTMTYNALSLDDHVARGDTHSAANPCAFVGHRDDHAGTGHLWHGTGDAAACQKNISDIMKIEKRLCEKDKDSDCLPLRPVHSPEVSTDTPHFLLTEGFFSIVDFAQWWLEHPGSSTASGDTKAEIMQVLARKNTSFLTIADLKAAAAILCSETWDNIFAAVQVKEHHLTKLHHVQHRCFELNYVVVLLSLGFGFPEDAQAFQFMDQLDGLDGDWSLGAFLLRRGQLATNTDLGVVNPKPGPSWFWTNCFVVALALSIFLLYTKPWQGDPSAGCLPASDAVQMGKIA